MRDRGGMNSDWRGILQMIRLQRETLKRLGEAEARKRIEKQVARGGKRNLVRTDNNA